MKTLLYYMARFFCILVASNTAMGRSLTTPFVGSNNEKLRNPITPRLIGKTSNRSNNGFLAFLGVILFLR